MTLIELPLELISVQNNRHFCEAVPKLRIRVALQRLLMRSTVIKSVLTLVVLGAVSAITFNPDIYKDGLISAYFSLAVACGAIILLNIRPYLADAVLVVCGAVLLALADYFVFGFDQYIMSVFS